MTDPRETSVTAPPEPSESPATDNLPVESLIDPPVVASPTPIVPGAKAWIAAPTCPPRPPVDRCAIASAICGLTAFIPVLSQIAGVVLGIVALCRIRRARRAGHPTAGTGWAVTGLVSSSVVLLSWIFVFIVFAAVLALFANTATTLDHALPAPPP